MIRPSERPRLLRECAVDLIRASDLIGRDASQAAIESAHRRLERVIADLQELEQAIGMHVEIKDRAA